MQHPCPGCFLGPGLPYTWRSTFRLAPATHPVRGCSACAEGAGAPRPGPRDGGSARSDGGARATTPPSAPPTTHAGPRQSAHTCESAGVPRRMGACMHATMPGASGGTEERRAGAAAQVSEVTGVGEDAVPAGDARLGLGCSPGRQHRDACSSRVRPSRYRRPPRRDAPGWNDEAQPERGSLTGLCHRDR